MVDVVEMVGRVADRYEQAGQVVLVCRMTSMPAEMLSPEDELPGCRRCGNGEDTLIKLAGVWQCSKCTLAQLQHGDDRQAWIVIAEHVASRPSAHSAATIRAVITNLMALAQGTVR